MGETKNAKPRSALWQKEALRVASGVMSGIDELVRRLPGFRDGHSQPQLPLVPVRTPGSPAPRIRAHPWTESTQIWR